MLATVGLLLLSLISALSLIRPVSAKLAREPRILHATPICVAPPAYEWASDHDMYLLHTTRKLDRWMKFDIANRKLTRFADVPERNMFKRIYMHPRISHDGKWVLESYLGRSQNGLTDEALFAVRQSSSSHGSLVRIPLPNFGKRVVASPAWIGGTDTWAFLYYDLRSYTAHLYVGRAMIEKSRHSTRMAHFSWRDHIDDEYPYLSDRLKVLGQTERNGLLVVSEIRRGHILLAERSMNGAAVASRTWSFSRPTGISLEDICWSAKTRRIALLCRSYEPRKYMEIQTMRIDGTGRAMLVRRLMDDDYDEIRDIRYLPGGKQLSFGYKGYIWSIRDTE